MFFEVHRRTAGMAVAGLFIVGLLSGCSSKEVTINTPNIPVPTIAPTIPVDFSKPLDQQVAEFNEGFKKIYCPLREFPIADAIADGAKQTWNRIVAESQGQNVGVPTFDPKDPAMCQ